MRDSRVKGPHPRVTPLSRLEQSKHETKCCQSKWCAGADLALFDEAKQYGCRGR